MNRREAMAALVSLPEVARISVARVRPSDVLVLEVEGHLSQDTALRLKAMLHDIWPNQKALVLDGDVKLRIVEGG